MMPNWRSGDEDDSDTVYKTINSNSSDSKTFKGGDDFIRYNFEDYLIAFLSSVKYDKFMSRFHDKLPMGSMEMENHIDMFNVKYVECFKATNNYKLFNDHTEDEMFNFFEPKHVGEAMAPVSNNLFKNIFGKWGAAPASPAPGSAPTTSQSTEEQAEATKKNEEGGDDTIISAESSKADSTNQVVNEKRQSGMSDTVPSSKHSDSGSIGDNKSINSSSTAHTESSMSGQSINNLFSNFMGSFSGTRAAKKV
ncbi:unnamed protein product [Ambrosiozyma monospora]|uniref:Unnamed protein product n=1 Tax=Ambrosiozyma monospora TaxID=43982 RepID=A0A9W6WG63_AMBMO|nr:unnamed protein product [Ambrosiozyma monospora]